jgi:SAM-dependent methyltransferase
MTTETSQSAIDQENASFWSELCGSALARTLGITDDSKESLARFDNWYFDFYPYLFDHIPFQEMTGRSVLEIGLGYGTVAQRLAEAGANYHGLDISPGPVSMVRHRLRQNGLTGDVRVGSVLDAPFENERFDYIVAIGCLHHTGNLQKAISECHRMLKPGGRLIFMVYYAYSYRRFWNERPTTLRYLLREMTGYKGVVAQSSAAARAAYDANAEGESAPHTDWISKRSLKYLCRQFSKFTGTIENIDQAPPFSKTPREVSLKTRWPSICGLDLYATAVK